MQTTKSDPYAMRALLARRPAPQVSCGRLWTREEIAHRLTTDDRWLTRGVVALYEHQTRDEQAHHHTVVRGILRPAEQYCKGSPQQCHGDGAQGGPCRLHAFVKPEHWDNGVGFNSCDAPLLSSYAQQILRGRALTPNQLFWARKKMLKYAQQLAQIANKPVPPDRKPIRLRAEPNRLGA